MSTAPFFAIVVPTYNRARLLPRLISSVQAQTFSDFELILVDDGSTDDSRAVAVHAASGDPRIKYHYQQNAERGAARNNGIRQATAPFVVFIDSDDEMNPDYLRILHDGINRKPGYNLYAAKYNYLLNGRELPSSVSAMPEGEYNRDTVLKGNPFSCNFCIRKGNKDLILFKETRVAGVPEDWIFLVENLRTTALYLFDGLGLSMHHHEGRSMQQNSAIINQRIVATENLILENSFSDSEAKILWGYTYYFCSIHAYIDGQRSKSVRYIQQAIRCAGFKRLFFTAWLKYIIGRKFINLLKRR